MGEFYIFCFLVFAALGFFSSVYFGVNGNLISEVVFQKESNTIEGQISDIKGNAIALKDNSNWTFSDTELLGIDKGDQVNITCTNPKFYPSDRTCTIKEVK